MQYYYYVVHSCFNNYWRSMPWSCHIQWLKYAVIHTVWGGSYIRCVGGHTYSVWGTSIQFSSNRVSMKMCRDASHLLLFLLLLFVLLKVLIGPTIPSYVFNLFSCFLYLYILQSRINTLQSICIHARHSTCIYLWLHLLNRCYQFVLDQLFSLLHLSQTPYYIMHN